MEIAYNQHSHLIYNYILRRTRQHQLAEDLTHEAIYKLAIEIKKGKQIKNTRGWLIAVASRLLIDHRRSSFERSRNQGEEYAEQHLFQSLGTDDDLEDPIEKLQEDEKTNIFLEEVANLPENHRQVLRLRYWDGQSTKQLENFYLTNNDAVSMRLSRARKALLERLHARAPEYF